MRVQEWKKNDVWPHFNCTCCIIDLASRQKGSSWQGANKNLFKHRQRCLSVKILIKTFPLTALHCVCINVILYLFLNLCVCVEKAVMEVKCVQWLVQMQYELLCSREGKFRFWSHSNTLDPLYFLSRQERPKAHELKHENVLKCVKVHGCAIIKPFITAFTSIMTLMGHFNVNSVHFMNFMLKHAMLSVALETAG